MSLNGGEHPIRIELCGRPVLIILWIELVRSSVYRAVVQLGLLQRQDLAERVYGGRAKLAVSIVSVLYSGHSRSLCNLNLREAA